MSNAGVADSSFLRRLRRLRASGGPKHACLSECFRQAIEEGLFHPGDRLPTEVQLVSMTPFSLGTVQRAIRSLVQAGLVERKHKLGTFVTRQRRRIDEPWHFRFLEGRPGALLPVYPTAVGRRRVRTAGPWSDYLKGRIVRIDRVVNVNDEFAAFSQFYCDGKRYPMFEKLPLESLHGENFRRLLHKLTPEPIERISHSLVLQPAGAAACRIMGVPPCTPCTLIRIAVIGGSGKALYYQELLVPPSNRFLELADPVLLRRIEA